MYNTNMNTLMLNEKWQEHLKGLPESGMGFQIVKITLFDGRQVIASVINCEQLNVAPDFPIDEIEEIELAKIKEDKI